MGQNTGKIVATALLSFFGLAGFVLAITGTALGFSASVSEGGEILDDGSFYARWWPLALQGAVTIVVVVALATGVLEKELMTCLGFLVLSTAVLMSAIHTTLWSVEYADNKMNAELAAAGLAILAIVNLVGIVLLGVRHSSGETSETGWPPSKLLTVIFLALFLLVGWGLLETGTVLQQVGCKAEGASKHCSYNLRFTWWTIAFELAILLWIVVSLVMGYMQKMGVSIAAFLVLVTSNLMDSADGALSDLLDSGTGASGELLAAGVLILCIVNIVVLLVFFGAGIMKAQKDQIEPVNPEQSAWVVSTVVTVMPLLLGLGLAVTGIVRVHSVHRMTETSFNNEFRSSYWSLVFEVIVIGGICKLAYFKKEALPHVRGFIVSFLVLASLETMREVGELFTLSGGLAENADFKGNASLGIAAAGFMVITAMNFVLILILGCEPCAEGDGTEYQAV